MTGNQYYVSFGFSHTRCDGADTGFRNQFDVDATFAVGVFQIENQLG
ncbi:Uncharacterised protein [Vibrio cholerae]|nr:Uncharacterised protein [Vibrio cholerae]CSI69462.1 Uncharacterised protein [Vibrio cholerae]